MSSEKQTPKLVELGANTREAASEVNMDVSGTVGPDYLGQETVNVSGHPQDRPGVQDRTPEHAPSHEYEISRMDTGEELPVLLTSSMSADPVNGVNGSYTQIVEGECARCGYDRLRQTVITLPGEQKLRCNACEAVQEPRSDDGYYMPKTDAQRAQETRDAHEHLGDVSAGEVYRMNDRAIRLIGSNDQQHYLPFDDVAELTELLVDEGCIDGERLVSMFDYDTITDLDGEAGRLPAIDRIVLANRILPKQAQPKPREWPTPIDGLSDEGVAMLCTWLFEPEIAPDFAHWALPEWAER